MNIVSVQRASIKLGDIPINAYRVRLEDNTEYDLLAGRNITDAVDQQANTLLRLMGVKSLKDLPHKNSRLLQVQAETGEIFTPVSLENAVTYWGIIAQKGSSKATALLVALAIESFKSRLDRAFGKKEEKIETQLDAEFTFNYNKAYTWLEARQISRNTHREFQKECLRRHYPAALVHDTITLAIFGDTAEAARLKQLVYDDLDPSIGLNHQEDIDKLIVLARVKVKFSNLVKGDWQDKVNRAVSLCCN